MALVVEPQLLGDFTLNGLASAATMNTSQLYKTLTIATLGMLLRMTSLVFYGINAKS